MDHQTTKRGSLEGIFRFSTDAFPERDRVTKWRETLERQIVGLDQTALTENMRIDGVGMALPGLGLVQNNVTPSRYARTREMLRDGNDNIRLVILKHATTSSAPAAHLGRDLTVEPGSAIVLPNCDLNSITFTAPRTQMLSLNLTRKNLRPLLRDFDAVPARTIPSQNFALRLLVRYTEALLAESAPPTPELRQLATVHIYDLAALAMGATRDASEISSNRGLRAARLREIKSNIAATPWLQGLSVDEIAIRQGVTPRYVQMLFEHEGTTFTEFVRQTRLDRAHRMLVDPRMADRSISAIAFDAGFGDLSYFNREFRRRFGQTPSDVRAAGARYAVGGSGVGSK
jgi:AraC-like DNA-binding protein